MWRVALELPRSVSCHESILPGDIIYLRRPRKYQWVAALMGDTWRHIGVATKVHGFTWMVEMNPFGFYGRPLESVVAMYDTVAVQRLAPCSHGCAESIAHRIISDMNAPVAFHTKPELVAIGLFSFSRLFRWVDRQDRLRSALWKRVSRRRGFAERAVCSTPIARVVHDLCDQHEVVLDVSSHKRGPQQQPCATTDIQAVVPDDIWRALTPKTRSFWVKKDGRFSGIDEVLDLTAEEKGVQLMNLGH